MGILIQKKFTASLSDGFTLIELLVVVAIIGILSSVVVASINGARSKSYAIKAISDVEQMRKGIEMAKSDGCATAATVKEGSPMTLCSESYISMVPAPPGDYVYEFSVNGTNYTDLVASGSGVSVNPNAPYFIRADGFSGTDVYLCNVLACSCSTVNGCKQ